MTHIFPYRSKVLLLLFFLILITLLDRTCISLVGLKIKTEFGLSNEQFGWVLGAFALAYAIFEIPSGYWGDRIGQRAVLIRIVLWWSLFTVLTGFATGFMTLIAIRFLFGMGEAGAFPNSAAVISRWFPKNETAKGMSALMVGSQAGAALAPLIVVPIAAAYGWRAPFYILGLIGLAWVAICWAWFRNHPSEQKAMPQPEQEFVERNRHFSQHQQSFPWRSVLKSRSLLALSLAYYCLQWLQYFFIAWMPIYLQEGRKMSESSMKFSTSYLFMGGIISAILFGILNDWLVKKKGVRLGRRSIAIFCFVMMGTCLLLTGLTENNTAAVIFLIAANFFNGPCALTSFSACVDMGGNYAGTVTGIMSCVGQLGAFFMAIIFGKIVDMTHSYSTPIFVLSAVLFAGGLLWLMVRPDKLLVMGGHSLNTKQ
jgi:ACS family glucarate transporter-like MFS transporter